jgi:hypothetical protein
VPPKLVSDLTSITFVGDHPDDLKTGINPFVVMDGSEEFWLAAQKIARNYTTQSAITGSNHNAPMSPHLPRNFWTF